MTNTDLNSGLEQLEQYVPSDDQMSRYVVDFDHTLFLGNSTEAFISSTRPASVFAILMKVLGALGPWRLAGRSGYFIYRDFIRLILLICLAPWTLLFFKKDAPALWEEMRNRTLEAKLSNIDPQNIIIVSFGFKFVIKTLLKGTRWENCEIVAPSLFQSPKHRKMGKLAILRARGIELDPKRDVVITDNAEDDADLVEYLDKAAIIDWPEKITRGAFHNVYIPFFYTARIKRTPGFLIKQIGLEELPVVLIAFSFSTAPFNWTVLVALAFFFIAFKLVYEIGYAENDNVGFETEEAPKLTSNFFKMRGYRLEPYAWIWSALAICVGVWVLNDAAQLKALTHLHVPQLAGSFAGLATIFAAVAGVIILSRIAFWVFNHVDLRTRVFAYLPLHMLKYMGWLVLFSLSEIGMALLCAQIVRTWSLYAIRRAGGDIDFVPSQLVRLCFFLIFLGIIAASSRSWEFMTHWQTYIVLAFCIVRAIPEVRKKMFKRDQAAPKPLQAVEVSGKETDAA